MKLKTEKDVTEEKEIEKICKNCKEPLRSNSKYKYCESCRRKRAQRRRGILEGIGGFFLMGLLVYENNIKDSKDSKG